MAGCDDFLKDRLDNIADLNRQIWPEIKTIKNGCIVCNGDITGNDKMKYLCTACMLNHSRADLIAFGKITDEKK